MVVLARGNCHLPLGVAWLRLVVAVMVVLSAVWLFGSWRTLPTIVGSVSGMRFLVAHGMFGAII